MLLQVPIIMVSKMKVHERQEHSTKTKEFRLAVPPEQSVVHAALGVLSKAFIWEGHLGGGFAQRCALYLEVSSVRIGLSLIFWEQSVSFSIISALQF